MGNPSRGNLARQMAAAPVEHHTDPTPAGHGSIADQLTDQVREAAIESSREAAPEGGKFGHGDPLVGMFGTVNFRLPATDREYPQRDGSVGRCLALVDVPLLNRNGDVSGIVLEARIYSNERTINDPKEGSYMNREITVSLPRAVDVSDDAPLSRMALDNWKETVLSEYDTWTEMLTQQSARPTRISGPRLVKRIKVEPKPAAPAQS